MINLQFSRGFNFVGNTIAWFDHGLWSHVDAVLGDGRLLGAHLDDGVLARDAGYLGSAPKFRVALPCSSEVAWKFYDACASQVGKPYDTTAIIGFVAERDWKEEDSWFCSELICWALLKSGYFPFPLANKANKVTPGDLILALSVLVPIVQPAVIVSPPPIQQPFGDTL